MGDRGTGHLSGTNEQTGAAPTRTRFDRMRVRECETQECYMPAQSFISFTTALPIAQQIYWSRLTDIVTTVYNTGYDELNFFGRHYRTAGSYSHKQATTHLNTSGLWRRSQIVFPPDLSESALWHVADFRAAFSGPLMHM